MTANFLLIVMLVACGIVGIILVWGISLFGKGADPKKSNKVMQLRILAQFIAVIIIVGGAWLLGQSGN